MSKPIIEVENLGKRYRLGRVGARSLRDELENGWRRLRGGLPQEDARDFWALRGVSFSVNEGEVLGIIGRNGSGKSTLLKLLSRITEPTTGRAILRGRVASLLEVGTGFHPELSGRENIFLNGAIMGMTRTEVQRKFDEIIDFAGVEQFLDTPVKRYSSGMRVRLGFAVAAHLEPEILIVDEVLAVGDAEFQRKCLGKMQDVATEGRTVLFVSHQMPMIQHLCPRALMLSRGKAMLDGEAADVIHEYLSENSIDEAASCVDLTSPPRERSHYRGLLRLEIRDSAGLPAARMIMGRAFHAKVHFELAENARDLGVGIGVEDEFGQRVISFSNYLANPTQTVDGARGHACIEVPELRLVPGRYWLTVSLVSGRNQYLDRCSRCCCFFVDPDDVFGTGHVPASGQGVTYAPMAVSIELT